MLKFSLTKAVGKGVIGASASDVETLQRIFAKLKGPDRKPLYGGRIDGKAGPKTIAAIECYQAAKRITVNGKVEPMGQTINKLKTESIPGLQAELDAAKFTVSKTSLPTSQAPKLPSAEKQQATYEIDKFEKSAPVRESEAKALAGALRSLMKGGIIVVPAFLDSDASGHITVELEALYPKPKNANEKSALITSFKTALQSKAVWTFQAGSKPIVKTVMAYAHLKGAKPASHEFLKLFGLETVRFDYSATLNHLGGIEGLVAQPTDPSEDRTRAIMSAAGMVRRTGQSIASKLESSALQKRAKSAIDALIAEAANFGRIGIKEAAVRKWYQQNIAKMSARLSADLNAKIFSPFEAVHIAHRLRGEILIEARKIGTDLGRALVVDMKAQNIDLRKLFERKANELVAHRINPTGQPLSATEVDEVYKRIIQSAGKDRDKATKQAKRFGQAGRALWVLSIALAAYAVYEAEDPYREAGRQASGIAGGIAGGAAAGAAAGLICGPGAPVCVGVGVFIGGILGGLGSMELYDAVLD